MGIGVEEFGFGYPPRMIGLQRRTNSKKFNIIFGKIKDKENKNIIYSINWIPFGGFVKIKGEQGENLTDKDSFATKKIWKRATVLSAGVAMNIIFAMILLTIGFFIGLPTAIDNNASPLAKIKNHNIQIAQIQENSPAKNSDLQVGDIIEKINGLPVTNIQNFQNSTQPALNKEISIEVKRGNEILQKTITPIDLDNNGKGKIGTWLVETGLVSYPWYYAIWMGVKTTLSITWQIVVAFYELFKNLIVQQQLSADVAGPVGIAILTGKVAKLGFIYLLQFTAILSINLAILNYIPFPALDGGRVLFLVIEKFRGRPVNQRIEATIHSVGFMLLMGLVLFITFKDLTRFSSNISSFFSNLF